MPRLAVYDTEAALGIITSRVARGDDQPPYRADPERALIREADDAPERASIYLYDVIDEYWGASALDMVAALDAADGRDVDLYVNSPGGDVWEAEAMRINLARYEGEITAHIDGIAASAATTVTLGADRVIVDPASQYMIHRTWGVGMGSADEMRAFAERLDEADELCARQFAERTGREASDIMDLMRAETWYRGREIVEAGFADDVSGEEEEEGDSTRAAMRSERAAALRSAQIIAARIRARRSVA